jgi:hypothetical protein
LCIQHDQIIHRSGHKSFLAEVPRAQRRIGGHALRFQAFTHKTDRTQRVIDFAYRVVNHTHISFHQLFMHSLGKFHFLGTLAAIEYGRRKIGNNAPEQ